MSELKKCRVCGEEYHFLAPTGECAACHVKATMDRLLDRIAVLKSNNQLLREALQRLASHEAVGAVCPPIAQTNDPWCRELMARRELAESTLAKIKDPNP